MALRIPDLKCCPDFSLEPTSREVPDFSLLIPEDGRGHLRDAHHQRAP